MRPDDLGHERQPEADAPATRPAVAAGEATRQPLDIGDLDAVAVVDDVDPHLTVGTTTTAPRRETPCRSGRSRCRRARAPIAGGWARPRPPCTHQPHRPHRTPSSTSVTPRSAAYGMSDVHDLRGERAQVDPLGRPRRRARAAPRAAGRRRRRPWPGCRGRAGRPRRAAARPPGRRRAAAASAATCRRSSWARVLITASGVRSSCEASATNWRCSSIASPSGRTARRPASRPGQRGEQHPDGPGRRRRHEQPLLLAGVQADVVDGDVADAVAPVDPRGPRPPVRREARRARDVRADPRRPAPRGPAGIDRVAS